MRIGTRRSPLALAQTGSVVRQLERRFPDRPFEVVPLTTSGDRTLSIGSPDFTDTIDQALRDGTVDLAVHSAKDLEATLPTGLVVAACPRRGDPRDALVVRPGVSPDRLPRGARVGSSSPRRIAQLRRWRADLRVVPIRGNVGTRLERLGTGRYDALVLAVAGLQRLGKASAIGRILPTARFLPAPGQGALALVVRAEDRRSRRVAASVDHGPTRRCVEAERAFAEGIGGGCDQPLGALARPVVGGLALTGEILSADGTRSVRTGRRGPGTRARAIGRLAAEDLRALGGTELAGTAR